MVQRHFSFGFFLCIIALSACTVHAAEIKNFKECVAAGNPVLRTFPARCVTPDNLVFLAEPENEGGMGKSICVNKCGDGECQEIVCMAEGCPCSETHESCPKDCS